MRDDDIDELSRALDVTAPTLDVALRRYREGGDPEVTRPLDGFLGFLRAEGIIDERAYRRASADATVSVAADPELDELLDEDRPQYEVFEKIAEGGMGEIRVGRDRRLRHRVAIKLLKDGATGAAVRRFLAEAQVTAQLDHPNVVPVYGLRATEGGISFAMKMVVGKTLGDLIEESRDQAERAEVDAEHALETRLDHFLKLCDAVAYAHDKGVLHRDLKPSNVMIGGFGELYVMDWGIARLFDDPDDEADDDPGLDVSATGLTRADQIVGTPAYLSPEQARGDSARLDDASDQYTLGLILYELVCLRRAYDGASAREVIAKAARAERAPIAHALGARIAPELAAIIARATAAEPRDRYPDVPALAADVRRFLRGEEVDARPDTPVQAGLRWIGRHRGAVALMLLAAIAAAAGALAWTLHSRARTVERARVRERALTAFQSQVATRAGAVDRQFLHLEGLLSHLGRRAAEGLDRGRFFEGPLYSSADYDRGAGPPDLGEHPQYADKPVSLEHAVYVLAPGVDLALVEPVLRRLAPLVDHYRWLIASSALEPEADEVPVRWVYVGLAEGIMYSFPGKGGYPADYDPRVRPWYRLGAGARTPQWGNPYIDLQGQGIVLPGAIGVWSGGRMRGVAGLEVTFDTLIDDHLQPADGSAITEAALVDGDGRVVVSSRQQGDRYAGGELHDALELPPYPVAAVAERIRSSASGQAVIDGEVIGFHPIPSLGWYYVARAPLDRLVP